VEALTSLVKCNMTAEIFRSLALFIVYAYHQPSSPNGRPPKPQTATITSRSGPSSNGPSRPHINTVFDAKEPQPSNLTRRQLGSKVLDMYTQILCEKDNTSNIQKFARTVTNKVFIYYSMLILTISDMNSGFCTFWQKMTQRLLFKLQRL
jgi:hypothetical protein